MKSWFDLRNKKQREADSCKYDRWAFPYGDKQKETINSILKEVLPECGNAAMAFYLIGREAYIGSFKLDEIEKSEYLQIPKEKRLEKVHNILNKKLFGKDKKKIPIYLMLIEADAGIDEKLQYPAIEEFKTIKDQKANEK